MLPRNACASLPMPTDPDQLEHDRARYAELRKRWHPSCLGSTSGQRRQLWRVGLEIGVVRRRIEEAERESTSVPGQTIPTIL